jgi:hypothetical protein
VSCDRTSLPLAAREPVHDPDAWQLLTASPVQVSVTLSPVFTALALACSARRGVTVVVVVPDVVVVVVVDPEVVPVLVSVVVPEVVVVDPLVVPEVLVVLDSVVVPEVVVVVVEPVVVPVLVVDSVVVGAGTTSISTERWTLPRDDWQVSVNVESTLSAGVLYVPLVGWLPDQPPLAAQLDTLADAQLSITVPPS